MEWYEIKWSKVKEKTAWECREMKCNIVEGNELACSGASGN